MCVYQKPRTRPSPPTGTQGRSPDTRRTQSGFRQNSANSDVVVGVVIIAVSVRRVDDEIVVDVEHLIRHVLAVGSLAKRPAVGGALVQVTRVVWIASKEVR